MKYRTLCIICLGSILTAVLWANQTAQADSNFFNAEYLGGGNCGQNYYNLPTLYSWNFPAGVTTLEQSGFYTINDGQPIQFRSTQGSLRSSSGTMNDREALPRDATTAGLTSYSYTETDYNKVGGVDLGGQTIKVVCEAGKLISASVENFGPTDATAQPTPQGSQQQTCGKL
jgi:hypothetical protein